MEPEPRDDEDGLVRCLDCGTIYSQPAGERDIRVCPTCGYVGWIAVSMAQSARENGS
jgi:predicted  nucleic acid-binding Zn-ribbon protein